MDFFSEKNDLRYMRRAEAFTAAVANLLGLIFVEALTVSTLWLINLHLPPPPSPEVTPAKDDQGFP